MTDRIDELLVLLKNARNGAVFTGAGISTLSGIRDFRGKNGVYNEPWHGMQVEDLLSLDTFLRDPSLFYGWAKEFVYRLEAYEPGPVHRVIARLEKSGYIQEVFTIPMGMVLAICGELLKSWTICRIWVWMHCGFRQFTILRMMITVTTSVITAKS